MNNRCVNRMPRESARHASPNRKRPPRINKSVEWSGCGSGELAVVQLGDYENWLAVTMIRSLITSELRDWDFGGGR